MPDVIHARVPGRLRLSVREVINQPALASDLERELLTDDDIQAATASSITGSLLVHYRTSCSIEHVIKRVSDALLAAQSMKPSNVTAWWTQNESQVLAELGTTLEGLSTEEVAERQLRYGRNVQRQEESSSDLMRLVQQFNSLPIILLCASATLSLATGGLLDAGLVAGVIVANVGIGFFTERNAERIINAFIRSDDQAVMVRRDGQCEEVTPDDLVPGDILMLVPGCVLPADARVLQSEGLTIDESVLTGESQPAAKLPGALHDAKVTLAERHNMAYCGTAVTSGSGIAAVVHTAFSTEVGRINLAVAGTQRDQTPMQREIGHLGRQLTTASVLCGAALFGVGWWRGTPVLDLIRRSTALAVAAIPEGLPTVATTILARGMQDLQRHGVLIRHLGAVETLGAVSVICFDKTGTLTHNRMQVTEIRLPSEIITVTANHFAQHGSPLDPSTNTVLMELLRVAALCNEATVNGSTAQLINGSSTENALLLAAMQAGIDVADLRQAYPRVSVQYRSESRRFMATTHDLGDDRHVVAIKGDPNEVLAMCRSHRDDHGVATLDPLMLDDINRQNAEMADNGLRVLGFAYEQPDDEGPIWLGMVGMTDPARPEMPDVIRRFHDAGIRTIMLTGDQVGTAVAVARDVALAPEITAFDCAQGVTPEQSMDTDVFARVSPLHKLSVVQGLKQAGHIVAMTGDGTNDGPALRAADIGVTLGMNGTNAARQVADMVLAEDAFQTMIVAVERGRTIYTNLRKAIHYLVATNSSEVTLTLAAAAVGAGQPLNTAQLLWINLITDVAVAFALGFDPPEVDVMTLPPRSTSTQVIEPADYRGLLQRGGVISASAFAAHLYDLARRGPNGAGVAMSTLLAAQLLDGFSSRSRITRAWDMPNNPALTGSILGLLGLQGVISIVPWARQLLGIGALDLVDLAVITAGAIGPFLANETLGKSARA